MAQPQSCVARNGAFALNDLADPVRRHLDLPGKGTGGQSELGELIAENFTGVDICLATIVGNSPVLRDDLDVQPLLAHEFRSFRDEVEAFFRLVAHELFDDFGGGGAFGV